MTLDEVVRAYIRDFRSDAAGEMRFFETQDSLTVAIQEAALCCRATWKTDP